MFAYLYYNYERIENITKKTDLPKPTMKYRNDKISLVSEGHFLMLCSLIRFATLH